MILKSKENFMASVIKRGDNIPTMQVRCPRCLSDIELTKFDITLADSTKHNADPSCTYTCPVCRRINLLHNSDLPDSISSYVKYGLN